MKHMSLVAQLSLWNMQISELHQRMGFVTQDDVPYPHLSVRETLVYAALLRLPSGTFTRAQKIARAEETIAELGLDKCMDTVIGGPFLRGVSGGERKRVFIGPEILVDPSLLFLDATSGLSMRHPNQGHPNQGLPNQGALVGGVSSSYEYLCHKDGGEDATACFGSEGGSTVCGTACCGDGGAWRNRVDWACRMGFVTQDDVLYPHLTVRETLVYAAKILNEASAKEELKQAMTTKREWSTSWSSQFSVLLVRGLKERHQEYLSYLKFLQVFFISLIVGCLWWRSKRNTEAEVADQMGLVFFIAIFWSMFRLFTAIFTFPQERAMLNKERASDLYRLSSYFMARTLGDLPLDLVMPTIFVVIVYFMTNLYLSAGAFFLTMLIVFLNVVTSQGLGFLVGATLMEVKKATTLASIIMLAFMLTGGFFVQSIPASAAKDEVVSVAPPVMAMEEHGGTVWDWACRMGIVTQDDVLRKRRSGLTAKAQRKVIREIKTARTFGLMPFTSMGRSPFRFLRSRLDEDDSNSSNH